MLRRITAPQGEYVDVGTANGGVTIEACTIERMPDGVGQLAFFVLSGDSFILDASYRLKQWGLYLRFDVDDAGWGCAILQDGRDAGGPAIVAVLTPSGQVLELDSQAAGVPPAFGQNCVEVVGVESGWMLFVQTSKFKAWRARLSHEGKLSFVWEFAIPLPEGTSQGFTDGSRDGTIRFLDQWRTIWKGITCASEDRTNTLVVGQNADDGRDRLRGTFQGGPLFVAHRGWAMEPHVVRTADLDGQPRYIICARTNEGTPAVIIAQPPFAPEVIDTPTPADPPPGPGTTPPTKPPAGDVFMEMPDTVRAEIELFVDQRPPKWTMPNGAGKDDYFRDYTGELASHLAFKFGPKWGTKRASTGRPNTKDAIAYQDTRILYGFDIFNGVGTNDTSLQIGSRGVNLTDPLPENEMTGDQVFVAAGTFGVPPAKDWLGGGDSGSPGTPDPDPGPGPTPDPVPVTDQQLFDALDRYFNSRKLLVSVLPK